MGERSEKERNIERVRKRKTESERERGVYDTRHKIIYNVYKYWRKREMHSWT